jgi:hypothetical protein
VTLEQAINFRAPFVGLRLRDMRADDWSRMFRKINEYEMMMDAFWRHQWDDEMDQRAHAHADRLDDLAQALRVILAPG